jgi:hypothetical protein
LGIIGKAQDECPVYVITALESVSQHCSGLGSNEVCYGHNRVDVTFWEEQPAAVFSQPADRISVMDIQSIATAPLMMAQDLWGVAVMNLQANLPGSLPGQNSLFLLMGDVQLTSNEHPPVFQPVAATTTTNANIRSQPSTQANVVGVTTAGQAIELVGMNTARDWYEIMLDNGGTGWIWSELVAVDDASQIATDMPDYFPMQAFSFTSGIGTTECASAPDALLVQSPDNLAVSFNINSVEIQLGSTVLFANFQTDTDAVLVARLLEGGLRTHAMGGTARLNEENNALAFKINPDGTADTRQLLAPPIEQVNVQLQNACQNALSSGMVGGLDAALCEKETRFVTEAYQEIGYLIDNCSIQGNAPAIHEGDLVRLVTGCCGSATVAEQIERQNQTNGPRITLDGQAVAIFVTGIFWGGNWYTNDGIHIWQATAGEHTVSGGWFGENTCTIQVLPAR